uniref:Si:ch211-122h15.4 n=1 Tax=Neogobius melanostomus TaxID=47308 RepID=A0A8C6TV22_9GOBI
MKVLTGSVAVKTLSGGGMEHLIEPPINGITQQQDLSTATAEDNTSSEKRWKGVVRRLRSGSSFVNRTSRSDTKKRLFGKPLSKVCSEEGSPPKAILEMLMLLRKHGPSTEGVFRKSCNNKKMLEVREQLDSGAEVQLEEQPVVLLVGLLKSFLKELPGSLLDMRLYDKWMSTLEQEDLQPRAEALQRVLDEMPRPNVYLLQHLLCVLHHIQEKSHTNMMDAHNLAVCIGPTLLCLEDTPLSEQPDRMKRVADLTEFLIEHWEILGDNIPNLLDTDDDSVSTQHHDSAYDSTDPDGDAEQAESSIGDTKHMYLLQEPSPPPSSKATFARRCSEPIIHLSADSHGLRGHARSHDDCSRVLTEQPLKKQTSDDAILNRRSAPSFLQSNMRCKPANQARDCSCSSIDSATSNQSEGSVFTNSPVASPTCPRRATSTPSNYEKPEDRKRSQSMKVLPRARSFNRISLKRADPQSESTFPCETLQEDLQSEDMLPKPRRPLSAIDVFKYIDSRLPCEPPTYEQAVQSTRPLPKHSAMTVQDAIRLDRRSRPSSVNYDWPTRAQFPARGGVDRCAEDLGSERVVVSMRGPERRAFRPRAMSECARAPCVPAGPSDDMLRRCSQPMFEEFSYAKESYV